MRSVEYASSRRDTDYTGGGGGHEFTLPVSCTKSGRPDLSVVQADLSCCLICWVLRVVEDPLLGFNGV